MELKSDGLVVLNRIQMVTEVFRNLVTFSWEIMCFIVFHFYKMVNLVCYFKYINRSFAFIRS